MIENKDMQADSYEIYDIYNNLDGDAYQSPESKANEITLADGDPIVFESLIQFCYSGSHTEPESPEDGHGAAVHYMPAADIQQVYSSISHHFETAGDG
ncbi:hypothetical protein MCOR10_006747, partial [Pyricularia oryzae]